MVSSCPPRGLAGSPAACWEIIGPGSSDKPCRASRIPEPLRVSAPASGYKNVHVEAANPKSKKQIVSAPEVPTTTLERQRAGIQAALVTSLT